MSTYTRASTAATGDRTSSSSSNTHDDSQNNVWWLDGPLLDDSLLRLVWLPLLQPKRDDETSPSQTSLLIKFGILSTYLVFWDAGRSQKIEDSVYDLVSPASRLLLCRRPPSPNSPTRQRSSSLAILLPLVIWNRTLWSLVHKKISDFINHPSSNPSSTADDSIQDRARRRQVQLLKVVEKLLAVVQLPLLLSCWYGVHPYRILSSMLPGLPRPPWLLPQQTPLRRQLQVDLAHRRWVFAQVLQPLFLVLLSGAVTSTAPLLSDWSTAVMGQARRTWQRVLRSRQGDDKGDADSNEQSPCCALCRQQPIVGTPVTSDCTSCSDAMYCYPCLYSYCTASSSNNRTLLCPSCRREPIRRVEWA